MARDGNVTLNDLRAELAQREAAIAKLRDLIRAWEQFGAHSNGSHPKPRRSRLREKRAASHASGGSSDRHRIRDAILGLVTESPGVPVSEAIRQLEQKGLTDSEDPRKVLSTRIGQFVRAGKLRRAGDKLYPGS